MSESMFGDRYFATRERLAALARSIASVAAETGTVLTDLPLFDDLAGQLDRPFVFLVCGEVNAGKSTLLNALLGTALCPVNILPETQRVRWYLYGDAPRDEAKDGMLDYCYRPHPLLRDLSVIDTPGTNARFDGHRETIRGLFPRADLIMFVFPVANPWAPATWEMIDRLPEGTLDRSVLVIQQADQCDAKDLQVILGHVADLANKRLGRVPPVFAVSGKLACEAGAADASAPRLWQASGLPALLRHLSESVCQSPVRRAVLDGWRSQVAAALQRVENRIDDQAYGVRMHRHFLDLVDHEIHEMREQFLGRVPGHLAGMAEVFEQAGLRVSRLLRRKLGAARSLGRLFTGDRIGPDIEAAFVDALQTAVREVATHDGAEVVAACQQHWQQLLQRVRLETGIAMTGAQPATLADAQERFAQQLGDAACQAVGDLKVRHDLDKDLRRRNRALKSFLVMTLTLTTAGAVCGALGLPWAPLVLCALAAGFFLGAVIAAWSTRRIMVRDFRHRLLGACGGFAQSLHHAYDETLRDVFHAYSASLDEVRNHVAQEQVGIAPRQRRHQELFLTLKAIEQDG